MNIVLKHNMYNNKKTKIITVINIYCYVLINNRRDRILWN